MAESWSFRARAAFLVGAILFTALVAGCGKSTAPVTDPDKAPWLFDPQSQIDGLKNSDYRLRRLSALNLGNMKERAAEALPLLENLAEKDPHPKVRESASQAAGAIRDAVGMSAD